MNKLQRISALLSGFVFAIGLGLSGMTHPSKVLAFLDLTGHWDPSLLFVMGAALAVNLVAFRWILRRRRPLLDREFHLPEATSIDARLVVGAALFGIGWGLFGFCPGPAVVSIATGSAPALGFVAAMAAAMAVVAMLDARKNAA